MKRKVVHRRGLAGVLLAAAALLNYPAAAAIVDTGSAGEPPSAHDQIREAVARPEVQRQLEELGVPPEEARARVDAMTDEEVRRIAGKVGALPAGGQLSNTELLIIVLLVAILLVVI